MQTASPTLTLQEMAASIDQAIAAQTAATGNVTSNTQKASAGARAVSEGIGAVSDAARATQGEAQKVVDAAGSLRALATELSAQVDEFLVAIRS